MHHKTILLSDPRWLTHPQPVRVHWLVADNVQHLVVEAPNWANAKKWGAQAALLAWTQLATDELSELVLNPADPDGLKIWVVVPGFPLSRESLWAEPFGHYDKVPRNPTTVVALLPISGTADAHWGEMLGTAAAGARWGVQLPLAFA